LLWFVRRLIKAREPWRGKWFVRHEPWRKQFDVVVHKAPEGCLNSAGCSLPMIVSHEPWRKQFDVVVHEAPEGRLNSAGCSLPWIVSHEPQYLFFLLRSCFLYRRFCFRLRITRCLRCCRFLFLLLFTKSIWYLSHYPVLYFIN
jgi:hypothetical protein